MAAITDIDVSDYIDDDEDVYVDTNPNAKFDLKVHGNGRHVLKNVRSDYKVSEIIELIHTEIFPEDKKQIGLISDGHFLQPHETLAKHGFPKPTLRSNYVTMHFQTRGGAQIKKSANKTKTRDTNRVRKFNQQSFPSLKKSTKEDCIYGSMEGVVCAAMPICGCAMAPQTMFDYIKSVFAKHQTAYKIVCPIHKSVEWDWDYCTEVADMSDDEYEDWSQRRNERKLSNLRKCPNCLHLCKRREDVIMFRMNCENCKGPDWCWECQTKWNNSGTTICGNKECTFVQAVNETLAKCPAIKPTAFISDVPSIRACPRCMTRMKWLNDCKHMTCSHCGKAFCFSCLALKAENGKWPCNGYADQCSVKQRQQFGKPDVPV
eukprot:591492_1